MLIKVIVENQTVLPALRAVHGLSLYIEAGGHKILFDVGPDDSILHNAPIMGVDLSAVDMLLLSHAHFDHTGALGLFLEQNKKAPVYGAKKIIGQYYAESENSLEYIGLPEELKNNDRLLLIEKYQKICEGLELFCLDMTPGRYPTQANNALRELCEDRYMPDRFMHEQSLLVAEGDRRFLFTGCAHGGICNIIQKAEVLSDGYVDWVIGGFHLHNPQSGTMEDENLIRTIADELADRPTRYLTCHCTGYGAYQVLKEVLGDNIEYISAGYTTILSLQPS
ncbi:MAG: MBL fold metallo-hydrolase [Eubacterium sp.]|jgi:7,8-dihydropterin-6-yl-methyl-4-(beta-D-ribofuranosyl)aminobenzene 5'-phosphate synthase|nr:MBL fold metallo-hydrolase [Eubacterium sp.]